MSVDTSGSENGIGSKKDLIEGATSGALLKAQDDCYQFTCIASHEVVNVHNTSYEGENGHTYSVHFEDGMPVRCTCKAFEYHSGMCKHGLACLLRAPIMVAMSTPLVTDGGSQDGREALQKAYSTHIEPEDQGGEEYEKCRDCEHELLSKLGGFDQLTHSLDCRHFEER